MTQLEYESSSHTVMGGVSFQPAERLKLGVDGVWVEAEAGLEAFDFDVPADFLAAKPNMSFDFRLTNTYSDLDVSRLELGFSFSYTLGERFALHGGYRYLDFDDDQPYLYDTSGSVDFYRLGLGWSF